jgi:hypothetical protein
MARTVKEIKDSMTSMFVGDTNIQASYNLDTSKTFDEQFSVVSIESILFYVVAFCAWTLEKLFDLHRQEVSDMIDNLKPHSLRWYVSKVKSFMWGKALIADTDEYDVSGMTEQDIEAMKIVKYAAAVEKSAVVYLKIATDTNGEPAPLESTAYAGVETFIKEVKDAGVVVEIINEAAEHFSLDMTIYYNPMILSNSGVSVAGSTPVQDTIKRFIKELPFNGEYRNVSLVDALQMIEGVVIPELHVARTSVDGISWIDVDAKVTPYSGYYKVYEDSDLNITFVPYETVSD